uniref:Glutamic acid-rich protein-like n=1 Tax=Diabrotica virgifera virgifera TaxID=50390 RepID=A0A6P7FSL3_DIAVI
MISRDRSREADPETVLETGQTAEKRFVKIRTVRPQMTDRARSRSPLLSMATPTTYEDSRKVNLNLFQELSSYEADGYSTVDDKSERDGDFKLPRSEKKKERSKEKREEKKKKSNEKNKSEEKKKDKENPEVEAMEEEVPDEAGRGTTKRARTANEASDEENIDKEELLKKLAAQKELMRQLFEATKTREAQYEVRLVKKDEEIAQQRAEIVELKKEILEMKDAMVKSQKQVVDRLDVLMEARSQDNKSQQQQEKPPSKLPKPKLTTEKPQLIAEVEKKSEKLGFAVMYKRTILTEKEQEEAARIMNSENDDSLSDILEPDEIPEMFLDSGSSYKPSSESGSSVEQNPVSDSEHTSDEAVSDLDENVPEMDSAPVNNQDDSDWLEMNPVSDSEYTSDEAVSDLENVPEMDSAPVNNQDDSDWLEIDDEPEVFDFSEIERLKIDISKECTPKNIFELLFDDDLFKKI